MALQILAFLFQPGWENVLLKEKQQIWTKIIAVALATGGAFLMVVKV